MYLKGIKLPLALYIIPISKKFRQNLFSNLRGGGQRSRSLPLPPLTSTLPPLVSLFLSRRSGRFACAKFSYFPFPRFLFTLFSPLSLLPPRLFPSPALFTSPATPPSYLLPCPPPSFKR